MHFYYEFDQICARFRPFIMLPDQNTNTFSLNIGNILFFPVCPNGLFFYYVSVLSDPEG